MRDDLDAAIESATRAGTPWMNPHGVGPKRSHSRNNVEVILTTVLRELPDDLTVREILDELGVQEGFG